LRIIEKFFVGHRYVTGFLAVFAQEDPCQESAKDIANVVDVFPREHRFLREMEGIGEERLETLFNQIGMIGDGVKKPAQIFGHGKRRSDPGPTRNHGKIVKARNDADIIEAFQDAIIENGRPVTAA